MKPSPQTTPRTNIDHQKLIELMAALQVLLDPLKFIDGLFKEGLYVSCKDYERFCFDARFLLDYADFIESFRRTPNLVSGE